MPRDTTLTMTPEAPLGEMMAESPKVPRIPLLSLLLLSAPISAKSLMPPLRPASGANT
jgi:hypothetical protein